MIHKIIIPTPFAVGDVNTYLLKGDALSLIDVGPKTAEAYEALKYGLKEVGYTFSDIEQVILTHHHPDHSGWVDAFDNAPIIGHPYNAMWLKRDASFLINHDQFYTEQMIAEGVPEKYLSSVPKMKNAFTLMGDRPLDQQIVEGDELPGHPGWTVLETLGHAQSHHAFWHEQTQLLIGGDLLLEKVSSNPLIEPPADFQQQRPRSLLQYHESLKRLLTLPVETIYTGHGNEVRHAHALIEERFNKQRKRAEKVLGMLENGPKTTFELTTAIFPTIFEEKLGLTLSETLGHIDYLIDQGFVQGIRDESGRWHYEKT